MKARPLRSALFTPGTEAARLRKAVESGADLCIFDLEDSVPPGRIDEARRTVAAALEELQGRAPIWVRVHSALNPAMVEDVAALPLAKADGVMIPKAGGAAEVATVRNAVRASQGTPELPLIPIIESAAGVLNAFEIATSQDVLCLAFGRFDLGADLGVDPDRETRLALAEDQGPRWAAAGCRRGAGRWIRRHAAHPSVARAHRQRGLLSNRR
jgi:citrate lyase subunit beta/citryl-CoA lyase